MSFCSGFGVVVGTLLKLDIEAGNARTTGQPKLVGLLGYWNNSSQWLSYHQPSMASTWFLRHEFMFLLVSSALEQQLQTSQGQHCNPSKLQELPCKAYDTGLAFETWTATHFQPCLALKDEPCQGCFPPYNHHIITFKFDQSSLQPLILQASCIFCWPRHIHCLQYLRTCPISDLPNLSHLLLGISTSES